MRVMLLLAPSAAIICLVLAGREFSASMHETR